MKSWNVFWECSNPDGSVASGSTLVYAYSAKEAEKEFLLDDTCGYYRVVSVELAG